MGHLIYDVAASLDGYIAGPDGDVTAFPPTGDHVDAYTDRLKNYGTVIMGRKTYEFGYSYGLAAGDLAYPGMSHIVVSSTIELPGDCEISVVRDIDRLIETVDLLKATSELNIYLCGGGLLAGYLLSKNCIDRVHVKLAPVILGSGVPMFDNVCGCHGMSLQSVIQHNSGVATLTYGIP